MEEAILTTKKGKRAPNFTQVEKYLLLELVNANKQVIENKKTDQVFSKDKEKAWMKLGEAFNVQNPAGIQRSWEQLKICYDNIKASARKHVSTDKVSYIYIVYIYIYKNKGFDWWMQLIQFLYLR